MPISRRDFIACAGIASIGSVCRPDGLVELQADRFVQFRNKFKGTVILPGNPEYDSARAPASFNPRTDQHPKFIARCINSDDIRSALEFARTESLEVAVRSGGHDPLGASVCEGGIVIDLSQMKSIVIDREHGTARVESRSPCEGSEHRDQFPRACGSPRVSPRSRRCGSYARRRARLAPRTVWGGL
jgi:hypothetical protein